MKELKFRAWHDDRMKEVVSIWGFPDVGHIVVSDVKDGEVDTVFCNFKLMQYTGLKDKNGKEIYEGDIVNSRFIGRAEVKFREGRFFPLVACKDATIVGYNPQNFEVISI